ncbi:hypothetical protein WDJ51_07280 [Rathayibacter sp. YIM 133350]|uniref:hypothetical protein n=1 Tax=Rathayibacter sp. YIM 133350 TaxID=3131992 RepID=UPI00307E2F24
MGNSRLPRMRGIIAVIATALTLAVLTVAAPAPSAVAQGSHTDAGIRQHPLVAVDGGRLPRDADDFDPGFIVSDYNFFNADAMTSRQVQEFLESIACRPKDDSPCLADYTETTTSKPAQEPGHCSAYRGAADESAARIITRVAKACGISPRTLLVLLQKEQSLLTRPDARGYLRATGYACPDTADCDADYFGFFNQVYSAAWQFRQYTQHPARAYHVGSVPVSFDPDAACGAAEVGIRNQATANLYNYTPYQPNDAALADLGGEGDACSSHGNLNFWMLYTKWFGDPTAQPYPTIFGPCANIVGGQPCRPPRWIGDGA